MKKVYQKPLAVIENFELSQHIAACQNLMVSNQAIRNGCDADAKDPNTFPVNNVFYSAITEACQKDGSDMYCYTNGADETFVFIS